MTPRECLAIQICRSFQGTCGCSEREHIAAHILVDLCKMNRWDAWLNADFYRFTSGSQSFWNHAHCDGQNYHDCSFDSFVIWYDDHKKRFQVTREFIDRMRFTEND